MSRLKPTFQPSHRTVKEIETLARIHSVAQCGRWIAIVTEGDDTIKSKTIKIKSHG